jgi:hypothetical protein
MKFTGNLFLRACCMLSIIVTCMIWIAVLIPLFNEHDGHQFIQYVIQNPYIVTYPLLCVLSVIILVKANSHKGILLFSLFLTLVSQNSAATYFFQLYPQYDFYLISTISFILTSMVFLQALHSFPQTILLADLQRIFPKNKALRVYLNAFSNNRMWLIFSGVTLLLAALFPRSVAMQSSVLLLVLFTGVLLMYVNHKISSPSGRNKIRWLLWGILSFTLLSVINVILFNSGADPQQVIALFIKWLRALSLFVSITMCLFFFDTFNTGVLIRRTIVDGIIFIVIVFLYNTIEHYFLHWITHRLHISSTLISSVLSGFFVLIFSPVHHKFMHVLDKRLKKKEAAH